MSKIHKYIVDSNRPDLIGRRCTHHSQRHRMFYETTLTNPAEQRAIDQFLERNPDGKNCCVVLPHWTQMTRRFRIHYDSGWVVIRDLSKPEDETDGT